MAPPHRHECDADDEFGGCDVLSAEKIGEIAPAAYVTSCCGDGTAEVVGVMGLPVDITGLAADTFNAGQRHGSCKFVIDELQYTSTY
ncbi:hypothetical protein [Breoghania sp.]|uniref:hypothetical protein n=1 Tax=Breoghania sp. TaxID=2065378 RepID=UPI00261AF231|nr:hypothetical protein [Breoghania sp.]MDJ0930163.1 hypothetical protein [Breoghania sp.]